MKKLLLTFTLIISTLFVANAAKYRPYGNFTSLGINSIQIGAGVDSVKAKYAGVSERENGLDVHFKINMSATRKKDWGIDVEIPLEYMNGDIAFGQLEASIDMVTFPIYAKPYYVININRNITIKPFLQVGLGGRFSDWENIFKESESDVALTWAFGGGIEVCFYKDFYIQGKYLNHNSSGNWRSIDYYATPEHEWSAEIGYRISRQFALIAQFSHVSWENKRTPFDGADLHQEKLSLGLRILF